MPPARLPASLALFLAAVPLACPAQAGLSPEVEAMLAKARGGDLHAQYRVGVAYDQGRGAPRDAVEAMKWYRSAAEAGYADAQNSVGSVLQEQGKHAEAFPWFEKAAAQENARALNNLAYFYEAGLGVAPDRSKAFELYSRSADLGWGEAMWNLSGIYGSGQLREADLVMACAWTVRAGRFAGAKGAKLTAATAERMTQMEPLLSAAQMQSCREQGESWSPKANAASRPTPPPDGD